MTTCTHLTHKQRGDAWVADVVRYTEACGLTLNQHGLCAFHDGPLCSVCGLTIGDRLEARYGHHKGCERDAVKRMEPVPMTAEARADAIIWEEAGVTERLRGIGRGKDGQGAWGALCLDISDGDTIEEQNRNRGVR